MGFLFTDVDADLKTFRRSTGTEVPVQSVATRGQVQSGLSAASTVLGHDTRHACIVGRRPCHSLEIDFTNVYVDTTGLGEKVCPNDFTIKASVEITAPSGQVNLIAYCDGNESFTFPANIPTVKTFRCAIDLAAGETFYIRIDASLATTSLQLPVGTYQYTASAERAESRTTNPSTKVRTTGAISGGTGLTSTVMPLAIRGRSRPQVSFCYLSDSIYHGLGDTGGAVNYGLVAKGLASVNGYPIPWSNLGRSTDLAAMNLPWNAQTKHSMKRYFTHCGFFLGSNDITTGEAVATTKSNLSRAYESALRADVEPVGGTIPPRVTGTYLTPGGQTPVSQFDVGGKRDQLNDWILAGADGLLTKIFDINPFVEDQSNKGRWKSNGVASFATDDGTHLSAPCTVVAGAGFSTFAQTLALSVSA